ncbi:hypothetical protein U4E84_09525 [Halorubrum sp. AD140]|uniref:hypothetical protein n=1 Tax=Halorubrum sp. AD140 TaxID=3050073 RepID=UPI002ACCE81F|nr:hypothetical protein [Halorubrum sp. AD140]MDZ5811582.1 hypothetical protein [Halorubrum sp. AD140]
MTPSETDPVDRPGLLAVTPSAERVFEWLLTLALLTCVLALLVGLITLELLVRL